MEIVFSKDYRYRLNEESQITTQGSSIFKGQDLNLDRNVCIKRVIVEGESERELSANRGKALREIKVMNYVAEITTNIPSIYDFYIKEDSKEIYIIMQWIEGKTLRAKMRVPELQFIRWMIDLADILIKMQKRRIFHKDIKPENIMINEDNQLFLIDFNISVSLPNRIEGSENYKAPEMGIDSKYVGRDKVDMFAIGVMLYEFYTGEVPRLSKEYTRKKIGGNFSWKKFVEPKEKREDIPNKVNEIIVKAMKLNPNERFKDNFELKNSLIQADREIRNGRRKR